LTNNNNTENVNKTANYNEKVLNVAGIDSIL